MSMTNPFWSERYRPTKVSEVILPPALKSDFQAMVDRGEAPNLLLTGPSGVGKTTVARAVLAELGYDVYTINGSLKGNIDTLRNEIQDFVSSVSFSGSRKAVLIDEADYLNIQSTQPALRNFMEEFSGNASFILTCNYRSKIMPALQSRCSVIDFQFKKADLVPMAGEFFKRVCTILDTEKVTYDRKVVGEVIKKYFPDWRRVLNELQRYAVSGTIDSGILSRGGDMDFQLLVTAMRSKDFTAVRKWVGEAEVDPTSFYRLFYDQAAELFTEDSVPQLVLAIAEYQYKAAHVADQEVNAAAFLVYVMASCRFR